MAQQNFSLRELHNKGNKFVPNANMVIPTTAQKPKKPSTVKVGAKKVGAVTAPKKQSISLKRSPTLVKKAKLSKLFTKTTKNTQSRRRRLPNRSCKNKRGQYPSQNVEFTQKPLVNNLSGMLYISSIY